MASNIAEKIGIGNERDATGFGTSLKVVFEKLPENIGKEYENFLIDAYADQFNNYRFKDPDSIRKAWIWEYIDNPVNSARKPFIWICRIEGKIAGQLCVMPVYIKSGFKIYTGGWCQDLIISPDHRNSGVGFFMIKHVMAELSGELDMLMVGGTNMQSYEIFKSLGFRDMGFIARNIMPLNIDNVIKKFTNNTAIGTVLNPITKLFLRFRGAHREFEKGHGIDIIHERCPDVAFDAFWKDISGCFGHLVKRDSAYLMWRFFTQPYIKYDIRSAKIAKDKMTGYIITKEYTIKYGRFEGLKVGVISDILFDPKDSATGLALINSAIADFSANMDMARCDVLDNRVQDIVRKAGFFQIKSDNRFLIHILNKELELGHETTILDHNKWYIDYSDCDMDLS